MKKIIALLFVGLLSGCAYTVFAPPSVLYSSESTIGVKYRSSGVQSLDEPAKAMELISSKCSGKYEVTNRTEELGWTSIDAICK